MIFIAVSITSEFLPYKENVVNISYFALCNSNLSDLLASILAILTKIWKQCKCSLIDGWIKKSMHTHVCIYLQWNIIQS